MIRDQLQEIILKALSQVYQTHKRPGEVFHAIEHMLSKCNTTSKSPLPTKQQNQMLGC
jgi:hypothetical protein